MSVRPGNWAVFGSKSLSHTRDVPPAGVASYPGMICRFLGINRVLSGRVNAYTKRELHHIYLR